MTDTLRRFVEVWLGDFEYRAPDGERPELRCGVFREYLTGQTLRLWRDELETLDRAPFPIGPESLFVAYYAPAEMSCFLQLGWPMPTRVLDLYAEFRCQTNGKDKPCGNSLLGALTYYGLASIDAAEKQGLRELAMREGSYTDAERVALLNYCESDVIALAKLLPAMLPTLELPAAVFRGRYTKSVALMEHTGTPIDTLTLDKLRRHWGNVQDRLIRRVDSQFGVFDGRTFKRDRFESYLARTDIPWPRLASGTLALDGDTFREMARMYPAVNPLKELRHTLGEMRLESLAVGCDGRNRTSLFPFSSRSGRNQPSSSRFIFSPSAWLRALIKPGPDRAVAYVDYSQQEFGIAAKLSGDKAMQQAYASGDPYLEFGKQAKAIPPDGTKDSHPVERDCFKVCALAVQYGMGCESLAKKLDRSPGFARQLLAIHQNTYPKYWKWATAATDHAMLFGWIETVFGWRLHVGEDVNPRSLANFPSQANGAECLRLACCLITERGINLCCPIHDAVLVEGPADEIDDIVAETQAAMREASEVVLDGLALRSDATIFRHPDRYMDSRGVACWTEIRAILDTLEPDPSASEPVLCRTPENSEVCCL